MRYHDMCQRWNFLPTMPFGQAQKCIHANQQAQGIVRVLLAQTFERVD